MLVAVALTSCGNQPTKPTSAPVEGVKLPQAQVLALSDADRARYQAALEQLNRGNARAASKAFESLYSRYSSQAEIAGNYALALYHSEELNQALAVIQPALSQHPKRAELHNLHGLILMDLRDFSAAETAFNQSIKRDKQFADPHYNLALLHDIYYQDIAAAYGYYQQYLQLNPEDEDTKVWVEQLQYSLPTP